MIHKICNIILSYITLYYIILPYIILPYISLYYIILYCITLYYIIFYYIILYYSLSHALKNTANQRPGLPLQILLYATGNMQWVVFHSTFPSLLVCNSLLGSIWRLLKIQLRNSSTPTIHYEHFRSRPEIFRKFPNTSENFRRFSENSKKP